MDDQIRLVIESFKRTGLQSSVTANAYTLLTTLDIDNIFKMAVTENKGYLDILSAFNNAVSSGSDFERRRKKKRIDNKAMFYESSLTTQKSGSDSDSDESSEDEGETNKYFPSEGGGGAGIQIQALNAPANTELIDFQSESKPNVIVIPSDKSESDEENDGNTSLAIKNRLYMHQTNLPANKFFLQSNNLDNALNDLKQRRKRSKPNKPTMSNIGNAPPLPDPRQLPKNFK